jgi:Tfp pilus assembly protein PilF
LGLCRLQQNDFAGAESYLLQSYDILQTHHPDRNAAKKQIRLDIISLYEKWGRPEDAQKYAGKL